MDCAVMSAARIILSVPCSRLYRMPPSLKRSLAPSTATSRTNSSPRSPNSDHISLRLVIRLLVHLHDLPLEAAPGEPVVPLHVAAGLAQEHPLRHSQATVRVSYLGNPVGLREQAEGLLCDCGVDEGESSSTIRDLRASLQRDVLSVCQDECSSDSFLQLKLCGVHVTPRERRVVSWRTCSCRSGSRPRPRRPGS